MTHHQCEELRAAREIKRLLTLLEGIDVYEFLIDGKPVKSNTTKQVNAAVIPRSGGGIQFVLGGTVLMVIPPSGNIWKTEAKNLSNLHFNEWK